MTIAQAFKHKKKLLYDIGKLENKIKNNNSHEKTVAPHYDVLVLLDELNVARKELILLKTAIIEATVPMYPKIFRLSELKSQVMLIRSMPKDEGISIVGYGTREREVAHVAIIGQVKADSMIVELEEEAIIIQEALDKYNYTTDIKSYT